MANIVEYSAGWHSQQHNGRISFRASNGKTRHLNLNDPSEFTVILTILSSANEVTIEDGIIKTGKQPVDCD